MLSSNRGSIAFLIDFFLLSVFVINICKTGTNLAKIGTFTSKTIFSHLNCSSNSTSSELSPNNTRSPMTYKTHDISILIDLCSISILIYIIVSATIGH